MDSNHMLNVTYDVITAKDYELKSAFQIESDYDDEHDLSVARNHTNEMFDKFNCSPISLNHLDKSSIDIKNVNCYDNDLYGNNYPFEISSPLKASTSQHNEELTSVTLSNGQQTTSSQNTFEVDYYKYYEYLRQQYNVKYTTELQEETVENTQSTLSRTNSFRKCCGKVKNFMKPIMHKILKRGPTSKQASSKETSSDNQPERVSSSEQTTNSQYSTIVKTNDYKNQIFIESSSSISGLQYTTNTLSSQPSKASNSIKSISSSSATSCSISPQSNASNSLHLTTFNNNAHENKEYELIERFQRFRLSSTKYEFSHSNNYNFNSANNIEQIQRNFANYNDIVIWHV